MNAVRAEWTKLRTTPGPAWLLLATAALTVALGAAVSAAAGPGVDAARVALSGVYLGQAPVAVLAVLTVSGEYSTSLIRTTVTAIPNRPAMLSAKALVLAVAVAGAAGPAVGVSLLAAPRLSLAGGSVLRAGVGTVAYLVLVALFGLGAAAAVRDSGGAVGVVLGLLYLPPLLASMVAEPRLHRLLERASPMSAGLAVQATTDLDRMPIGPWAGLGVLAVWSAAALVGGALLLRYRDI